MPVRVIVPTPLRQYVGKQDSVEIEAKTVAEALAALTQQYGDLRRHLFTDDGKIRSFVNIYLNDEDIRYLQKDQTPVQENDVISIVPSIAGGTEMDARRHPLTPPFVAVSLPPLRCPCR